MLAHEYHGRTLQPWDDKYPESWGLVQEDGTLTNGGLLFSDNCEVYQSRVFCTRWNGLTKTDAINDAEYSGNLLYLLQMMRGFIKSNTAKRRNPIIADVFTQLDYMEKRGSGFQKITELTSELRLFTEDRMPTFESDASSFFTTVHSVLYGRSEEDFQRVIDQESTPKEENTTQKTTPKTENSTPKTNPKEENSTPKKLGATAQSILDVLSEDPYLKREEIAELVGLKLEGLKYQLGQLQKKGYLLRIEGRKSGRWKVLIKK